MRKLILLLAFFLMLASSVLAQVTLDDQQYVNIQIASDTLANGSHDPAKTVYLAESGKFYAFDGTLNVDFDLVILGPDATWIMNQTAPPVFLQFPAAAGGTGRDMIHILSGGSTRIKNVLFDGNMSDDNLVGAVVINQGGYRVIFDNCAFGDIIFFTSRNQAAVDTISYTNCIFVNMVRKQSSPFNGMICRLEPVSCNFIFENNTLINGSRLFGNGGTFNTSTEIENHNTYLNMQVNGHEVHWYEALQANNIYYNWSYRGRNLGTNHYEAPFTTWDHHYDIENVLDSISLYEGNNAFYLDPAFPDYWNNTINPQVTNDSLKIISCFLWDTGVDTTQNVDDNFTIGKNYWQFDIGFTNNPSKTDSMKAWDLFHWATPIGVTGPATWPDWRIPVVVDYDAGGQPALHWPPDFDFTYSNSYLQTAGTDGLPIGDLNWYPNAKATYDANRDQYIADLRDSILNATRLHVPFDSMSSFITPDMVDVKYESSNVPDNYYLSNNYPNPFNPSTTIRFGLPEQSEVTFTIFNVLGQKVYEETAKNLAAGEHLFNFNASQFSSGVYIYSINATGVNGKNFVSSKKMMLLK
jgi:Secretion system C-terminal sorting domain